MRHLKTVLCATTLICVLALASVPARAEKPTKLESNRDWTSYTFQENGSPVCYMASQPLASEGNYKKRGDVFMFVTHRPSQGARGVVSFLAGYNFGKDATVDLSIDGNTFTLFTQGDRAWTADSAGDQAVLDAMKKGSKMVVRGKSSRGTQTTDTFSLNGVSKALRSIDKTCEQ